MSVVICYSCDLFSMIATDTRISYGRRMDDAIKFTDDNEKLEDLPDMGWLAGAGAHSFIEIMKDKLRQSIITSNEQVKNLFIESYSEIEELNIYDKNTLDITGIATSWIGFNPKISLLPLFRVGIFSSKTIYEKIAAPMLEKNMIYILYPYEYIIDDKRIDEFEKKYSLNYIFDGDYYKFIYLISCMFKEITANSKSVSNICDMGIMNFANNGIQKIRIKENVNHLIADYNNGYRNTKFEVVWSIQLDNRLVGTT